MAKAREIPGLTEATPYALAAARVVSVRTEELADHATGVLDVADIERLHDMRVATRRLRAALEVFAPCFPRKAHRTTLREVKALADALGERRDRDVTIAALERVAAALTRADRPGIESLVERLRREQSEANEALAPFMEEARMAALRARLDDLVRTAQRSVAGLDRGPAVAAELAGAAGGNGAGPA